MEITTQAPEIALLGYGETKEKRDRLQIRWQDTNKISYTQNE